MDLSPSPDGKAALSSLIQRDYDTKKNGKGRRTGQQKPLSTSTPEKRPRTPANIITRTGGASSSQSIFEQLNALRVERGIDSTPSTSTQRRDLRRTGFDSNDSKRKKRKTMLLSNEEREKQLEIWDEQNKLTMRDEMSDAAMGESGPPPAKAPSTSDLIKSLEQQLDASSLPLVDPALAFDLQRSSPSRGEGVEQEKEKVGADKPKGAEEEEVEEVEEEKADEIEDEEVEENSRSALDTPNSSLNESGPGLNDTLEDSPEYPFGFNDESDDETDLVVQMRSRALSKMRNTMRGRRLNGAMARDAQRMNRAAIDAVRAQMNDLQHSKCDVIEVPLSKLVIEDRDELKVELVSKYCRALTNREMPYDSIILLGWEDKATNKVVVENGRHRLAALLKWLENFNKSRAVEGERVKLHELMVRTIVIRGGKLAARIRKLAMENKNKPTVFEKIMHVRFMLRELNMIDNPAMTMEIRCRIVNEGINATDNGKDGFPLYMIQAACFSDEEFKFIMRNARNPDLDNCNLLREYITACSVNPSRSLEHLMTIDGEMEKNIIKDVREKLKNMKYNIFEFLTFKEYDDDDAHTIQSKLHANADTFHAIKRLHNGSNRLANRQLSCDEFMKGLEKCYPPIVYLLPEISRVNRINQAASTLHIMDAKAFEDETKSIVTLLYTNPLRPLNFIIVGEDADKVKKDLNAALEQRRTEKRRSSQPTSQAAPFNVGAAPVSVQCVLHNYVQGSASVPVQSLNAVLLRSTDGCFLEQNSLCDFMTLMRITGSITSLCLRLLTYDPERDLSDNEFNSLFVHGFSTGPFAVAARCAVNRITSLSTTSSNRLSDMASKQFAIINDWDQKQFKECYTKDGNRCDPSGVKKTRRRVSKLKIAQSSGLIRSDE